MTADPRWRDFRIGGRTVSVYCGARYYYALDPFGGGVISAPDPERVVELLERSAARRS
ncbi:MAG: hypothetical protein ACLP8V_08470 [Thermoplasmata archaeon]